MIIEDVKAVEVDEHRWNATIRITKNDGTVVELFACAEINEHSGLFLGDPDEHGEH